MTDDESPLFSGCFLPEDKRYGGMRQYLHYAALFHQRYGSEEQYLFYLHRLEEWLKIHERSQKDRLPACYYCGYGNEFKL